MRRMLTSAVATMCFLSMVLISLSSGGCDDLSSSGSGTLTMLVTDKPFPFEFITEASVVITRVEVRQTSSDSVDNNGSAQADDLDSEDSASDGDGPFMVVFEDEEGTSFNLLELQNGVTASLLEAALPAGDYTQVRLIVSSGHITLEDTREFDLNVPSGEQTGIKIRVPFAITAEQDTTLLMDIDLSKAFVPIPGGDVNESSQIQSFHFKPSQAVRITELEKVGAISGMVTDEESNPLEDVSVTAFLDGEEVTSTATTAEGTYVLSGLEAGSYTIEFSLAGWQDGSLSDVEATAGDETDARNFLLEVRPRNVGASPMW